MKKQSKKRLFDVVKGEHPLCFRCEHRAKSLETKAHAPRCECGDVHCGKHSCYCYEPVKPLVIEPDKGERRPLFAGWMLSGRGHAVGVAVTRKRAFGANGKMVVWHEPTTIKQVAADQKKADTEWKKHWLPLKRKKDE
jgi:hypothetical protein